MHTMTTFLCVGKGYGFIVLKMGKRAFNTPKARSITFLNLACAWLKRSPFDLGREAFRKSDNQYLIFRYGVIKPRVCG